MVDGGRSGLLVAAVRTHLLRRAAVQLRLASPRLRSRRRQSALSSTWFCAAGTAPPRNRRTPAAPGESCRRGRRGPAHGVRRRGTVGAVTVEVPTPGPLVVDVGARLRRGGGVGHGGVDAGELVVEHRLVGRGGGPGGVCDDLVRMVLPGAVDGAGRTAQLVLFNPFSADASVDISAAVEDGIRVPPEWQGLVVPAGSRRVVDLGGGSNAGDLSRWRSGLRNGRWSPRRRSSSGRASRRPSRGCDSSWVSAAERSGASPTASPARAPRASRGVQPRARAAGVAVQVTPFGAAALPPEPFERGPAGGTCDRPERGVADPR